MALRALSDGVQATCTPLQETFAELAKDEISHYPIDWSDRRVTEAFRFATIASLVKPETRAVADLLREIKAVRAMVSVRAGAPSNDSPPEDRSLQSGMSQNQARAAVVRLLDALYLNAQGGRFLIAERLGFRAHEIASRSLPQFDRLVLRAQFGWAQSLELCGLLQPALAQLDDLVASQQTTLDDTDDDTLASKQIRARVLCHLSRHDEALKEIEEVVKVMDTKLSHDHPDMLFARLLCIEILDRAGQKQEALARINPLLGLARKVWGPQDRRTFSAWHRTARLLGETKAFDAALKMVEDLIAEEEATHGSDHHVTLQGRALRASILFKSAPSRMELSDVDSVLESLRQMHGSEYPETLDFRHMRAQVLTARGEFETAYVEAKTLPASFERVYGASNPDTLAVRHLILRLGHLLNDPEISNPHVAEQMLASMIAALGRDHPITIATEKLQTEIRRVAGLDERNER